MTGKEWEKVCGFLGVTGKKDEEILWAGDHFNGVWFSFFRDDPWMYCGVFCHGLWKRAYRRKHGRLSAGKKL